MVYVFKINYTLYLVGIFDFCPLSPWHSNVFWRTLPSLEERAAKVSKLPKTVNPSTHLTRLM